MEPQAPDDGEMLFNGAFDLPAQAFGACIYPPNFIVPAADRVLQQGAKGKEQPYFVLGLIG